MTTPFWCLFVVAMLPYVLAGLSGYFKIKQFGRLDSNHPRIQAAELRGIGARTYASQMNAWEAVALFAAAVLVAHLAGADPRLSARASVIFVIARLIHPVLYISNLATLRTGVFTVGFLCSVWLFVLAAQA